MVQLQNVLWLKLKVRKCSVYIKKHLHFLDEFVISVKQLIAYKSDNASFEGGKSKLCQINGF